MLGWLGGVAIRAFLAAFAAVFTAISGEARDAALERVWHDFGAAPSAEPGIHDIALSTWGPTWGDELVIPPCNGRKRIVVDGTGRDAGSNGPFAVHLSPGAHDLVVQVNVSRYEKRIACAPWRSARSFRVLRFASPNEGKPFAGEAVLFLPRGHDVTKPAPLLVGLHPWNGTPWTYAAYRELVEEAEAKDVVLLMPSGLGNSLYTADAEEEVMRAIDASSTELAIDRQRVSLWGASMGGAGATTIAFHRPDRFAFVASYFGDSKYDLSTYVDRILGGERGAHAVNALDVVDNARHVPVWLIHGEEDRVSPIVQSTMLFTEMKRRGFSVEFERVPGMGHEGPLVVRYIRQVVDRAADARAPRLPSRVTYRSVRAHDAEAYGVRIESARDGDAFVDLEGRDDGVHIRGVNGVAHIVLLPGALGAHEGDAVHLPDGYATPVNVRWEH